MSTGTQSACCKNEGWPVAAAAETPQLVAKKQSERDHLRQQNVNKYGACEAPKEQPQQQPHQQLAINCDPNEQRKTSTCSSASSRRTGASRERLTFLQKAARKVPGLGIMLALCASLFLGTAGMLVKMTHSVHGIQVAVLRALIQLLVYTVIINLRKLPWVPRERSEWLPVAGRAVLGAVSITFSYYALKLIPLGDATTIRFSLPIWTLIVGYLLLGESFNPMKVFAVLIAVSGVVLIAKPDDCVHLMNVVLNWLGLESKEQYSRHLLERDEARRLHDAEAMAQLTLLNDLSDGFDNQTVVVVESNATLINQQHDDLQHKANLQQLEGCLMALASSICLSLSLISMRLCRQTPTEVIILWLSLASMAIGTLTLVALNEWRLPNNWLDVLYILLNGLCGSAGQWFITSALKIEQSGVVALARTFDIEVAFLYSALLLQEHIRATSIVGSVLVSSGVIIVVVPKWFGCGLEPEEEDDDDLEDEDEQVDAGQVGQVGQVSYTDPLGGRDTKQRA